MMMWIMALLVIMIVVFGTAVEAQSSNCNPPNSVVNDTMKTIDNKRCFFPFKYDNVTYNDCTGDTKKWCATTCNFERDYQFSLCRWGIKNLDGENCKNLTEAKQYSEPETVTGEKCVFPFFTGGKCYNSCTRVASTYPWCATTASMELYPNDFVRCLYNSETLDKPECANVTLVQKYRYPDTISGAKCVFPFIKDDTCQNDCIDTGTGFVCATDKLYNENNLTYCKFLINMGAYATSLRHGLYTISAECKHSTFCGGTVVASGHANNSMILLVKDTSPYNITYWEVIPQPDSSVIIRVPISQYRPNITQTAWTFSWSTPVLLKNLEKYKGNTRFVLEKGPDTPNVFSLSKIVDNVPTPSSIVGFRAVNNDIRQFILLEDVPVKHYWKFELIKEYTKDDLRGSDSVVTDYTRPSISKTDSTSPSYTTRDLKQQNYTAKTTTVPPEICHPSTSIMDPSMKTTDNKRCFFPFIYENKTYVDCAGDTKRWCATTCNFDRDYQFSLCRWEKKNIGEPTCQNITDAALYSEPETASGAKCVFPFVYGGKCYNACTREGSPYPWCGTKASVDINPVDFVRCLYNRETLYAPECTNVTDVPKYKYPDTTNGTKCVFPFINSDSTCKNDCIDNSGNGFWCSTGKIYDGSNWAFCKFLVDMEKYANGLKHGLYTISAECTYSNFCGATVVASSDTNNSIILLVKDNSSYPITIWEVIPQPESSVIIRVSQTQTRPTMNQPAWSFSASTPLILKPLNMYRENTRFVLDKVPDRTNVFSLSKIIDKTATKSSIVGFRVLPNDSRPFTPLEEVPMKQFFKFQLIKEYTKDELRGGDTTIPDYSTSSIKKTDSPTITIQTIATFPKSAFILATFISPIKIFTFVTVTQLFFVYL